MDVVGVLRDVGFAATDVSVLVPENLGPRELQAVKEHQGRFIGPRFFEEAAT
jgi:hypothetical protein